MSLTSPLMSAHRPRRNRHEPKQRMSAFSQRLVHGDGELLGGVGAAVRPAHKGLALQEHFLGLRLDAENLRDRKSDSE